MIDSKIKYGNGSPKSKFSPERKSVLVSTNKKKDDKINLEKMIRKPSKFFFQDLNTVLYR